MFVPTFLRWHTKTQKIKCHSERSCHRSTTQLWNTDKPTQSNHTEVSVHGCHGSSLTSLWDLINCVWLGCGWCHEIFCIPSQDIKDTSRTVNISKSVLIYNGNQNHHCERGHQIFKDGKIQGTSPPGGTLSCLTREVNLLHVKEPQAPRGPLSKIIGHFPSKSFGKGLAMSWSFIQGVLPIVEK
jgi:hypothetical protein